MDLLNRLDPTTAITRHLSWLGDASADDYPSDSARGLPAVRYEAEDVPDRIRHHPDVAGLGLIPKRRCAQIADGRFGDVQVIDPQV
jgi:hypothetical protein